MLGRFKTHIEKNLGKSFNGKILATVSGGVDSLVLCHLFNACKIEFSIAHCNFQLRGKDSDLDEKFVEHFANTMAVDFYVQKFQTDQYAADNGISIQMAARELRYSWFRELKKDLDINLIATAHHKNDNVETVLLNLVRGTGRKGLVGINYLQDDLLRPLLPFTKSEILDYAEKNHIRWREDVSNQSSKYKRNLLRNKVIPLLEELNPNFIQTFSENIEKFVEENKVIESIFSDFGVEVDIEKIKSSPSPLLEIWNWIEPVGFTYSDAKDIFANLDMQSGKQFLSGSHEVIKDRNKLFLREINEIENNELIIYKPGSYKFENYQLRVSEVYMVEYNLGEQVAFLNSNELNFPITIRHWKSGDKFQPLGMKGSKLISDFLIDNKVSLVDKRNQLVLETNGEIAWLIGRRISENFKVFDESKVYKIELI